MPNLLTSSRLATFYLFVSFLFVNNVVVGQNQTKSIYGSWVKTKVTYQNGAELPDDNMLKGAYVKYLFSSSGHMNASSVFEQKGTPFIFDILNSELSISTPEGSVINRLKIIDLSYDKMILVQSGHLGFDDPTALKYTFLREEAFQQSLPLNTSDIYKVEASDTTYIQCPKVYALYKGDGFQKYIYDHIGDGNYMTGRSGRFKAGFIVSKTGIADSLKVYEGISEDFSKRFVKAFNKAKKDWLPANLNGRSVAVEMFVELNYSTFENATSAMDYAEQGTKAFDARDYGAAMYFYDQVLKIRPTDIISLFKRGMCKKKLGNATGACEDWKKIKVLGSNQADDLLAKYCH